MKELHSPLNRKIYYISMLMIIILMVGGLILSTSELHGVTWWYGVHFLCVLVLSVGVLIYPKYETVAFRTGIILLTFVYVYTVAIVYPQTWTTYILICFLPALAILFYDSKLFYLSLFLNAALLIITFGYIYFYRSQPEYDYILLDLTGNFINITISQIVLFLIFHLTVDRMRKQQLYFEQLQQAERLKMITHLTAAVAHEIRNPVTVVSGFLQLYRDNPSFEDSVRSKFSLMIEELNTVEQVTSQFLAIAKPSKDLQMERVDVRRVIEGVTGLLSSYAVMSNKHMDIQVDEDCTILMNTIEFKQVIINLVKNALEASGEETTVQVTAKCVNQWVEVQIRDQGSGMSEDEVNALGTPFYSLKTNGTGLGLMVCFNIVEKVGGNIKYHSKPGKGTTVIVRLPSTD